MSLPSPEEQITFLVKLQRVLSEGGFVSTYKYALLHSLADLAVERGDDTTEVLHLDTIDLAERFVALYWRQVTPWVAPHLGKPLRLRQATGGEAAILSRVVRAQKGFAGSLALLRQDKPAYRRLLRDVARVIGVMPLWRLQTVGGQELEFLYPNVGKGHRIELRGDAIYCFRRFYELVRDLLEAAWVRFVRGLRQNREVLGDTADLRAFLFGTERSGTAGFRPLLREVQGGRCFYCEGSVRGQGVVDHFIPWARYALDLGHNLVLADAGCNGDKSDRLASVEHLERWWERNLEPGFGAALVSAALPHGLTETRHVGRWVYSLAEASGAQVWEGKKNRLVALGSGWRGVLEGS